MILVDANILLYAHDSLAEFHKPAKTWWDAQLSGTDAVGLPWQTIQAFLRISTNPRLHKRPLTVSEATDRIESWFAQPCVKILQPTDAHWTVFRQLVRDANATGNLITDAHLAALAIEHRCELFSSDADFSRFKSLKWRNPLR